MRDNKPLELEAENFVCSRLAKMNLRYSKPNFDLNGGDIIVINQIDRDTYKSLNIQVKGRDITSNNSNISIHKNYIVNNFVFFLYLRIHDDFNDYLYCFFVEDFKSWELKGDVFYLNIPQKSIENSIFIKYSFTKERANKLNTILENQLEKHITENTEWNLTLLDHNIRLWQITNCLPDYNLTVWFLENTNISYSLISHDIFLTCLVFIHSDKLEYKAGVDYMFSNLKNYEVQTDADIIDIEVISTYRNNWLVTYKKSHVDIIRLKYNGVSHNAFRLVFGDKEEQIDCLLIDNGDMNLTYK